MNELHYLRDRHQKISNTGNYCFLGVSVAFIICAYIQWKVDGVLPAWLYLLIASASLSISLFEIVKDLLEALLWSCSRIISLKEECSEIAQKHIGLFSKIASLEREKKDFQRLLINDDGKVLISKNKRRLRTINKVQDIITCIEIILVTVMIITAPLRKIPYDEKTTRIINVITILSFGVMFLAMFIKNIIEEEKVQSQAMLFIEKNSMSYYLSVIDKIIQEKESEKKSRAEVKRN